MLLPIDLPQDLVVELLSEWLVDADLLSLVRFDVAWCVQRARPGLHIVYKSIRCILAASNVGVFNWIFKRNIGIEKLTFLESFPCKIESSSLIKVLSCNDHLKSVLFYSNPLIFIHISTLSLNSLTECELCWHDSVAMDVLVHLANNCRSLIRLSLSGSFLDVYQPLPKVLESNQRLKTLFMVEAVDVKLLYDIAAFCKEVEEIFMTVTTIALEPLLHFLRNRGKLRELEMGSDSSGFLYAENNDSEWNKGLHISGTDLTQSDVQAILMEVNALEIAELSHFTSLQNVTTLLSHSSSTMRRLSINCLQQCEEILFCILKDCIRLEHFTCFLYERDVPLIEMFCKSAPVTLTTVHVYRAQALPLTSLTALLRCCPVIRCFSCNIDYDSSQLSQFVSFVESLPDSRMLVLRMYTSSMGSLEVKGKQLSGELWDQYIADSLRVSVA